MMAYLTSGRNKIMGSSVSTDANVVTVIDDTCTDEQVPSALATKVYVDNKEVKISAEENNKIEIKDDGIFVSKDYVEITQAEYDLLTEEEKEDIVFYIKDATSDNELVTVIDENSTDEEIPSAKAVHTAIQNVSVGVPADVYSKTEVDDLLADKADSTDIIDAYTKTEVDTLLANKANTSAIIDAYSKTEVNDLLDDKANVDDIIDAYTKTEVDGLLNAKVDSANIVTTLSSSSTDAQIPSAKTVFDAIESVSAGVPADVYSKTDVDDLLANKADTSAIIDAYTKTEVNNLMDAKANANDVYAKTDVDDLLSTKADSADIIDAYTKEEVDDLLADKADSSSLIDAYTKEEVNTLLDDKVNTDDLVDAYSKEEVNNLLNTKADSSAIVDSYTKIEIDDLLADKADSTDIIDSYTKGEVDTLLTGKADSDDLNNVYTKEEVNNLLDGKVGTDDVIDAYTKTEVDGLLATKADSSALDSKVNKTAIVTSVSSTSTDEQVPSAKLMYDELDYLSDQTAMTLDNVNLANRKIDETQMDIFDNVKPSIATNTANIATNTARIDNIPNPNILINGGFQINEYNVTSIPSSNNSVIYVTNRWATSHAGLSCAVNSVNEDVPFDSNKKLTLQASTGCTGLGVYQIIENVDELYNGKTLTLSFWVKGVSTGVGKTVTGRVGSGGGNTGETRVTLTDSWQYVTSTRTGSYFGPKFDGGAIITSSDTFDSGAGFEIACVKLEVGNKATPFVNRAYTEELLMCQRYYMRWKGSNGGAIRLGNFSAVTANTVYPILYLPTPMRTTPTLPSNISNLQAYGYDTTSSAYKSYLATDLSIFSMDNNVVTFKCVSSATFSVGSSGIFQIKLGNSYDFVLDAELYS